MEKKKINYIKFVRISKPLKGKIDLKFFKSDSAAMGTILLWKRRTTVKLKYDFKESKEQDSNCAVCKHKPISHFFKIFVKL